MKSFIAKDMSQSHSNCCSYYESSPKHLFNGTSICTHVLGDPTLCCLWGLLHACDEKKHTLIQKNNVVLN